MLIKEWVFDVQNELKKLKENEFFIISSDVYRKNPFLKLESDLTYNEIEELLLTYQSSNAEATAENLADFINLLAELWNRKKNNDASYFHSPFTRGNKASQLVARKLALVLDKLHYELLMPTVDFTNHSFCREQDWNKLQLQELIILDDEKTLVEVLKYIDLVEAQDLIAMKKFSNEEQLRLLAHSEKVSAYFSATFLNDSITTTKAELELSIKQENYQVSATYGDKGNQQLMQAIAMRLQKLPELLNLLTVHLPKKDWNLFLKSLSNNDLFRLCFSINIEEYKCSYRTLHEFNTALLTKASQELIAAVDKLNLKKEENDCAWIFCLLEIYARWRKEGSDYQTSTGYWTSYLPLFKVSYDKQAKLQACEVLKEFLLCEDKNFHDIDGFVAKFSVGRVDINAMKQGLLGKLLSLVFDVKKTLMSPSLSLSNRNNISVV